MTWKIIEGDCLEIMKGMDSNSIDAIVTDPPAGIAFMGKDWDKDKGGRDAWVAWASEIAREALRVVKPGTHAFVWALPRTSHWTALAWENAGFEIRDRVVHAFGSGFPKSQDISKAIDKAQGAEREVVGEYKHPDGNPRKWSDYTTKRLGRYSDIKNDESLNDRNITAPATPEALAWAGFGTALKPAVEDWWLLRKPIEKGLTIAENCIKWGVGALDVDGARIEHSETPVMVTRTAIDKFWIGKNPKINMDLQKGRWPANLTHDGSDEVTGMFPENTGGRWGKHNPIPRNSKFFGVHADVNNRFIGDSGSASRFFYCAKPSPSERGPDNNHPTVKSIALMVYLIKLISREGQIVLDPFMGSGSTGVACQRLARDFIGIEQNPEYCAIARKRITGDAPLFQGR